MIWLWHLLFLKSLYLTTKEGRKRHVCKIYLIIFFDQARHVEYKDPIEEEWEKFQKEIKEEVTVSSQIIEEDHEEATAERQIEEIDEQLRNWNRYAFSLLAVFQKCLNFVSMR